ncbi:MAG: type III pantothenate kinase [Phycisphaerales bacterium JB039]
MAGIVLCALGNSRARIGRLDGEDVVDTRSVELAPAALDAELDGAIAGAGPAPALVVASVNPPAFDRIESRISARRSAEVYLAGRDMPITVTTALKDPSTVGHDRLLCALAAFRRAQGACIVIDAGTAITVDFIDGAGVFHGGAIAPGVRAMLRALPQSCPRLPQVEWTRPDLIEGPFGRETVEAMLVGVRASAVGLVRLLIDRYAEFYRAYPRIIATGGDAADLFSDDPVIEQIVPDLQLVGLADICRQALGGEAA